MTLDNLKNLIEHCESRNLTTTFLKVAELKAIVKELEGEKAENPRPRLIPLTGTGVPYLRCITCSGTPHYRMKGPARIDGLNICKDCLNNIVTAFQHQE